MGESLSPENKYLSLTGLAIELDYVDKVLHPQMEEFKRRFFDYHVDEPVLLHRKDIVKKRIDFEVLRNKETENQFNRELLKLINDWEYTVFTVVIDQIEHKKMYKTWQFDPYHYCLRVLLERFILFLERKDAVGDVMAESRGGKQDMKLKGSFTNLYESGSEYIEIEKFQDRLTSQQLKVKPKLNNIVGLQLADLIAHPSWKYVVAYYLKEKLSINFGARIIKIIRDYKYYRSPSGKIGGWGIKLLP